MVTAQDVFLTICKHLVIKGVGSSQPLESLLGDGEGLRWKNHQGGLVPSPKRYPVLQGV